MLILLCQQAEDSEGSIGFLYDPNDDIHIVETKYLQTTTNSEGTGSAGLSRIYSSGSVIADPNERAVVMGVLQTIVMLVLLAVLW